MAGEKRRARKQKKAYVFGGTVCFVQHPHLSGLYIKTHVCVAIVACKGCGAELHEPCRSHVVSGGGRRWLADTHVVRRKDAGLLTRGLG